MALTKTKDGVVLYGTKNEDGETQWSPIPPAGEVSAPRQIPGYINPQDMTGGSVNPENWGDVYMDASTGEKYVDIRGKGAGSIGWFGESEGLEPWQEKWKQYLSPYVNDQGLVPLSAVHVAEQQFPMPVDTFQALSYGPFVVAAALTAGIASGALAGAAGAGLGEAGLGAAAAGEGLAGSGLAGTGLAEAGGASALGSGLGGLEGWPDLVGSLGNTGDAAWGINNPLGSGQFQSGGGMFDDFFDLGNFNPFESLDPTFNASNPFQLSDPYGALPANLGGAQGLQPPFQPNFNLFDPSTYGVNAGQSYLDILNKLKVPSIPGGGGDGGAFDQSGSQGVFDSNGNPLYQSPGGGLTDFLKSLGMTPGSLLGGLGQGLLGAFGAKSQADALRDASSTQANALKDLQNQFLGLGAPYRDKLAASYQPGFSIWDDQATRDAASRAADISARGYSSTMGNPFDSQTAQGGIYGDVLKGVALPQLNTYRSQLGGFGQLGVNTAGTAGLSGANALGQNAGASAYPGIFNAIGTGLDTAFNPRSSVEDLLKQLQGFKIGSGGVV